jgi:hypothetical protein
MEKIHINYIVVAVTDIHFENHIISEKKNR